MHSAYRGDESTAMIATNVLIVGLVRVLQRAEADF
jgi:hypothetical protein